MPAIDAHVHVWLASPETYPWRPLVPGLRAPIYAAPVEDLIAALKAAGLSQAVLTQPAIYGADNGYLASCLARYPQQLVGICQVDPNHQPADQLVHWLAQPGFRGLRLNPGLEPASKWLDAPGQEALWEAASALRVPISLRIAPRQLPQLEHMLVRFAHTTVVIDYLNGEAYADPPIFSAIDHLARLARFPQLNVKLLLLPDHSLTPYPHPDLLPLYERLYQAFGGRRLIWGSSWPDTRSSLNHRLALDWVEQLPFLGVADREWVLGGTAAELWRLPMSVASGAIPFGCTHEDSTG